MRGVQHTEALPEGGLALLEGHVATDKVVQGAVAAHEDDAHGARTLCAHQRPRSGSGEDRLQRFGRPNPRKAVARWRQRCQAERTLVQCHQLDRRRANVGTAARPTHQLALVRGQAGRGTKPRTWSC
jgi:hypothetical protein